MGQLDVGGSALPEPVIATNGRISAAPRELRACPGPSQDRLFDQGPATPVLLGQTVSGDNRFGPPRGAPLLPRWVGAIPGLGGRSCGEGARL